MTSFLLHDLDNLVAIPSMYMSILDYKCVHKDTYEYIDIYWYLCMIMNYEHVTKLLKDSLSNHRDGFGYHPGELVSKLNS